MKEQLEAIASIIRSAWRFRWSALLVIAIVATVGSLLVLIIPGKYESHAQIFVDTKSVLRPLLQGLAVATQARDETDVVRQALLARPSLDRVARKTGLYKRVTTPEGAEKLLTELGQQILIRGDSSVGLYTISYADPSASTAQEVVQTLLDTFVENSIGAGRTDTQNAEKFLAQQVLEYEKRLSDSEQKLAEFKKKNIGLMPDQRGDYFVRLQAELTNRNKLQTDLAVALQQRDELRRKLSTNPQDPSAVVAPPTNQQVQAAIALDTQIRDTQKQLDELLDKYTDQHPQVVALRETLQRLAVQRQRELGGVAATNAVRSGTSSVPVDAVMQNLQIALNTADVQVATLQTQLKQSESQVAELQRTVTTGPEIEAELARLNRDYGVTKTQYETLLQRLETARISNDADRSEELRFKVLEPPRLALRPALPNRPLLLSAAFLFSVGVGVAVAALRAVTQPVFFSKNAIRAALQLPVIGVVTRAYTSQQLAGRRRDQLTYGSVFALLIALVVAAAVLSFPASQLLRRAIGLEDG